MKNKRPKILIWDIENSHNLVLSFDLGSKHGDYIPHGNIIQERHFFCIGYKWLGEKTIHNISLLDDPKRFKKDIHDDYYVISEFRKILEEADGMIYHNGDKFDLPMLNARLAFHNLPPVPKIPSIDTKKVAWNNFRFNSNRLDYLAKFLGYKGKTPTSGGLWIDCFHGSKEALKEMVKYNKNDIDINEFVYDRLSPFMKTNPINAAAYKGGIHCVRVGCEIDKLQWRGFNTTSGGSKYQRFQCGCGKWGQLKSADKSDEPALVK